MRDLTIALLARWIVQGLCIAAVVNHGGNMLLTLALAIFCGAGLLWSVADEMSQPDPLT